MIIESLKHSFPARALEWFNAAILTSWGFYLLIHPNMLTDGRVAPLQAMGEMARPAVWIVAALVGGVLQNGALYVNGAHRRTPMVRLAMSALSAFIWTQVSIGIARSNIPNFGVIIYPALIVAAIYSAFRAAGDMVCAEQQYRVRQAEMGNGRGRGIA